MRFIENYPIDQITPADYNPRKIKENAFEKLQESLLKFGVCKAVIANLDGTIVAGHQRTKAMKTVGIDHCPIFILEKNVFDYAYLAEIKYITKSDGTEA